MATGSGTFAYHSTIQSTTTADVVTLTKTDYPPASARVEIYNRGSIAGNTATQNNLYVRLGNGAVSLATDSYVIPPGSSDVIPTGNYGSPVVVAVVCDGGTVAVATAVPYSVILRW
jgi:hypothetical protein